MGARGHSTIAAISSPAGGARRGIVRVSGPRAGELVTATLRGAAPAFDPRVGPRALAARFDDGQGLQPVTLLWMPAPRSFTREDVAEFHLPGAEPLLECALARLLALGAELARPGEFTRRAFLNGRLDLSRAEGVLAMTEAANESERVAAASLLDGALEGRVATIRERLLALATALEASLDFDEAETGEVPRVEIEQLLAAADAALDEALGWEVRRAPRSALPRVLLLGPPNAGKSSLWNALTGGAALVSDRAGTTRDALEAPWAPEGARCLLIDAPGLDPGAEGPAARAQRLRERLEQGVDLRLFVADSSAPFQAPAPRTADLLAWTKIDLPQARPAPALGVPVIPLSVHEGRGLDALARAVARGLVRPDLGPLEAGAARALQVRHAEALGRARAALAEARALVLGAMPLDLAAEAVRASLEAVEELTGRTTPEDVLERIFARFCLGK